MDFVIKFRRHTLYVSAITTGEPVLSTLQFVTFLWDHSHGSGGNQPPNNLPSPCWGYAKFDSSASKGTGICTDMWTSRQTSGQMLDRDTSVCIWKSLPASVTASETLGIFKRRLKTHLFAASLN